MNELLKYADWLDENITDEQFDFEEVVTKLYPDTNCGSICCAVGWLPAYSSRCEWVYIPNDRNVGVMVDGDNNPNSMFGEEAGTFFGISNTDAANLFSGNSWHNQGEIDGWGNFPVCDEDCTVKQLTNAIRYYVEIKS